MVNPYHDSNVYLWTGVVGSAKVPLDMANVKDSRKARYGVLDVPNRYTELRQPFGSYGWHIEIKEGTWVGEDPRSYIKSWQLSNAVLYYVDSEDLGLAGSPLTVVISDYASQLVAGIPTSILIYYDITLDEVSV